MVYSNRLPADFARSMASPAPHKSKVAERLLAHARLCRQMACASIDEALGEQLLNMAEQCVAEAAAVIATDRAAEIP